MIITKMDRKTGVPGSERIRWSWSYRWNYPHLYFHYYYSFSFSVWDLIISRNEKQKKLADLQSHAKNNQHNNKYKKNVRWYTPEKEILYKRKNRKDKRKHNQTLDFAYVHVCISKEYGKLSPHPQRKFIFVAEDICSANCFFGLYPFF